MVLAVFLSGHESRQRRDFGPEGTFFSDFPYVLFSTLLETPVWAPDKSPTPSRSSCKDSAPSQKSLRLVQNSAQCSASSDLDFSPLSLLQSQSKPYCLDSTL